MERVNREFAMHIVVSDQISWQEIWSLTEREKVVSRKGKMRLTPDHPDVHRDWVLWPAIA